jgi:non-specific serine/threonine protein kinase
MGEVFLARDPRLEREVAIKMLPTEVARDSARMSLFRSEALALAAVNHPNIATIFGFEESESGELALVLERVEGVTLAERLRQGAMPPAEALRVCVQIAEALEAAHARGVIHRDLKPGNVMLGPGGRVKVLDFGLARHAGRPAVGHVAETIVVRLPQSGSTDQTGMSGDVTGASISGTPSYMSPEQVQGTAEDERTDVFAFGCVLYECLTGRRAFDGSTVQEIWNAIVHATPDWTLLPLRTPERIRKLLERCLEKMPQQRLAPMRTVRLEIEEALGIHRATALRSGAHVPAPHRLPIQPTTFVARKRAVESCLDLLRTTRLLTITGVGGVGKTRLALRLAEMLANEFPDGAWFVDLASLTDSERIPQAVATVLGIGEEPGAAAAEAITRHLAGRRALIVLDNCEHVLDACGRLAHAVLMAAPHVTLIATSREGLSVPGESTYSVPSMSLPDTNELRDLGAIRTSEAVQLFVDRAVFARPEFVLDDKQAPTVAEICRRLDGIPLAIELAAARVRVLSVQQILARLHDRFRLLAGGRGALPRHQTLRASIQWSYDQLTTDEQRLLRLVSVFAGGWTLEAVTAGGEGWDEFQVLDLLSRLVEKSLVIVERHDGEDTRYRCLETVRQYGAELLIERGEVQRARSLHRDWYLALAERATDHKAGPDQERWHDRLETEIDNMRVALEWCREDPRGGEPALRLAAALQWFWAVRGYFREGRQWIAEILARTPYPPSSTHAQVLMGAGNLAWRQDDLEAARRYFERSLEMRREIGDEGGIAGLLGSLGNVAQSLGEWHQARSLFEQTLEISRRDGHKPWQASSLTCLGNVSRLLRDFEVARTYLEEAVSLTHEMGNRVGEAIALQGLGHLMADVGDIDAAVSYLDRSMTLHETLGDHHTHAAARLSLAAVAVQQGDPGRARILFDQALRASLELESRIQLAIGLEGLASLSLLEQDAAQAVRMLGAADALREAVRSPLPPSMKPEVERTVARAREVLGQEAYAVEWERGRRLTPEQAIGEVLGGK